MPPPFPHLAPKWEDPILEKHFQAHPSSVLSINFNHNGRQLVSGSKDGNLKLWNFKPQVNSYSFKEQGPVVSVCFSPTGKVLASASGSTVRIRTPERKSELYSFRAHLLAVRCVDFSFDSDLLSTCSDDKFIKIWKVRNVNAQFDYSLGGHNNWVQSVKFSPDGKMLASCSDDATAKVWDLSNRNCVRTCFGHTGAVKTVDFHSNGFCLATGGVDETIRIWDLPHAGKVNSVNFHPNGQYLAVALKEGAIKLYDMQEGRLGYTLHGHQGSVNCVQFSKQGDYLSSADSTGKIFLWRTNFDSSISGITGGIHQTFLASPRDKMESLNDGVVEETQVLRPHRSRSVESATREDGGHRHTSVGRRQAASPTLDELESPLTTKKLAKTLEEIVQQLGLLTETVGLLEKRLSRTESKVLQLSTKLDSR